jgi:hypothetical protein
MACKTHRLKRRRSSKKGRGLITWLFGRKSRTPIYDPEKERKKYRKTAQKYLKNMGHGVKRVTRKRKFKNLKI